MEFSLLRRENLSSAVKVLTNTLKIFHITLTETFCNSIALTLINKYGKGAVVYISTVFGHVYHVAFRMVLFLHIHLITFFRVRNFGNTSVMRVIFF